MDLNYSLCCMEGVVSKQEGAKCPIQREDDISQKVARRESLCSRSHPVRGCPQPRKGRDRFTFHLCKVRP